MSINNLKPVPTDKILMGLLAVVVTAVLSLFIALSFFDYPSADDFCYAAKARQLGFIGAQAFWYEHWSGRYTLNLVYTAFSLSGDLFKIYRFPPIMLLISTWLGFCFLIARITQKQVSTPRIFLLGGIGTVLFIAGAPDIAQTFYWPGGSFTYQIPNILLIFLLGLLIWRETTAKNNRLRILIFLLSSLLVIAIIGANEVSLVLTVAILGGGVIYALRIRRDSGVFWTGLLMIAIGAVFVSVLAPGNYQRYADIAHDETTLRPSAWLAAGLYLPWVVLRILYWLSNLGVWASAAVLLAATFHFARAQLYADGKFKRWFLALPALWISMIFMLSALGFLINRHPLPERAESVVYLLFLLGWYPSFIILIHFLIGDKIQLDNNRPILPAAALLLISLLGSPNIFEAYKDVYRGYRYAGEMRARIDAIQAAKNRGETKIVVASVSRPPRTLFATDLETDPRNFRNTCMSEYYGVESITLGPPK